MQLEYGFQLECRFCKKFEVNASHNPQRNTAQMKEDAARRRFLEELLTELYYGSAQLDFRHKTGRELTDVVLENFGHVCFNCGEVAESLRNLALDHTRPLALLWPLDRTATALCSNCNSEKRDRPPSEFYSPQKLAALADITGIPLSQLMDPSPNLEAIRLLKRRLDWFFEDFLSRPELQRERGGKTAAELLVKALSKVIAACPVKDQFPLADEFEKRRNAGG